jgi:hypothetical protein
MAEHLVFIDPTVAEHGALALAVATTPCGRRVHIVRPGGPLDVVELEVGARADTAATLESRSSRGDRFIGHDFRSARSLLR